MDMRQLISRINFGSLSSNCNPFDTDFGKSEAQIGFNIINSEWRTGPSKSSWFLGFHLNAFFLQLCWICQICDCQKLKKIKNNVIIGKREIDTPDQCHYEEEI